MSHWHRRAQYKVSINLGLRSGNMTFQANSNCLYSPSEAPCGFIYKCAMEMHLIWLLNDFSFSVFLSLSVFVSLSLSLSLFLSVPLSTGNVMHLVSSGGQHHLISQPAQVAVLSTASTHPVHTSPAPIGTQLPLSVSSQGFPLSPSLPLFPPIPTTPTATLPSHPHYHHHHHPYFNIHTTINLNYHPLGPTKSPLTTPSTPPNSIQNTTNTILSTTPSCPQHRHPLPFSVSILLSEQNLGRKIHSGVIGWESFFLSFFVF